jgi:hypothetical protein
MLPFALVLLRLGLVASVLLTLGATSLPAQERVGVNSAVNPEATGVLPGIAGPRRLVIGQDVIFNEHITTGATGQTQLLFLDESSMTIGPKSDLTIDQFAYDPKNGTGKLAMSATRGLLRYVGGKLSKRDAVTLQTPTATLAVRGGVFIVQIQPNGATDVIFLFGKSLTITGLAGGVQTVVRPGYQSTINPGGSPSPPAPPPPGQLAQFNQTLSGQTGATGGATTIPSDTSVVNSGISQTISGNITQSLQQTVQNRVTTTTSPTTITNSTTQTASALVTTTLNSAGQIIACTSTGTCNSGTTTPVTTGPAGSKVLAFSLSPPAAGQLYLVAPASTAVSDLSTTSAARVLLAKLGFSGQGGTALVLTGTLGAPVLRGVGGSSATITSPLSSVVAVSGSTVTGITLASSGATVTGGDIPSPGIQTAPFTDPTVATALPTGVGSNRTTQTLTGFFGGTMTTTAQSTPYAITGSASISTDSVANAIKATFTSDTLDSAATGGVTSVVMNFGGQQSAFIDNNIFGAAEDPATTQQINGQQLSQSGQLYLISSASATLPTSLLPSGVSFCQCQFLQWGYWGGDLTDNSLSRTDHGHINFWVAGIPTVTTPTSGIGTYTGHAIGSVFNNGSNYVAAGSFGGTYNFATQSTTFGVSNFDGKSFAAIGAANRTGANYTFGVSGSGLTGTMNGTFFGPAAAETGGNFSVKATSGATYLASGIFVGKQ